MATPSAKHLLFFLFLLTFYCPQIQARESQFFSKFTLHHNNLNTNSSSSSNITTSATITNTTTPKKETKEELPKEEAFLDQENENGHGLFRDQESTQFPPTTMTTTILAEAPTEDYSTYEEDNNNNPEALTEGLTGTQTDEFTSATYEENNNNNWSEMTKKHGMSDDPRFVENGRYFYNTNVYRNSEYRSPSLNQNGFGSSSRGGEGEMDNYNNAGDNTFDDDEFNHYMDQDQPTDQYVP